MCRILHHLDAVCDVAKCQEMKPIPVRILFLDCPLQTVRFFDSPKYCGVEASSGGSSHRRGSRSIAVGVRCRQFKKSQLF